MDRLTGVKSMNDVLPEDMVDWHVVEKRATSLFARFGFGEVRTPIVEYTALFSRGIGEATDIVEKEMYTFEDRDGRSVSMRPEGTASAVRAYIEHSVHAKEPVTRWYYSGPMFRHERAQRGRYRQFYQMGCEVFGAAAPSLDAEIIAMVAQLLSELGLVGITVRLSSVGSNEDRQRFREMLVAALTPHKAQLCADCQRRLTTNPLRILDCKQPGCIAIARAAPRLLDNLGPASAEHFQQVRNTLDALGVGYQVDANLVRGLDYYTGTVFECTAESGALGSQNTLCAGGRYDNLVAELGGPPTPAFGFAFGVERMVLALAGTRPEGGRKRAPIDVYFVCHGDAARQAALKLCFDLRTAGLSADLTHGPLSFKAQMKRADHAGARYAVLLGDDELAKSSAVVRDMKDHGQTEVAQSALADHIKSALAAATRAD